MTLNFAIALILRFSPITHPAARSFCDSWASCQEYSNRCPKTCFRPLNTEQLRFRLMLICPVLSCTAEHSFTASPKNLDGKHCDSAQIVCLSVCVCLSICTCCPWWINVMYDWLCLFFYYLLAAWEISSEHVCLSVYLSICLSLVILCRVIYLLIFVLIWATSSDEHLVARHCALYCFVVIQCMFCCAVG